MQSNRLDANCICAGNHCMCSGSPRLKDELTSPMAVSVRVPMMMSDSGQSPDPKEKPAMTTIDTMPTASMTLDDALKLPRYQGMSPGNARQYATRDLAMAQTGNRSADYQQGVRDHHNERLSDAWKPSAPVNDNRPVDPQFAQDGRPFAQLSDSDKARERMHRDLGDAWKN